MPGRTTFELDADEIVEAALAIFREDGLDAVSMRTVAARLGVSPVPLYSRVGNKASLLGAMADHVLADVAPRPRPSETWQSYALRWATALRDRLMATADIRLLLGHRRAHYVEASKPLVEMLRAAGFAADAAVQSCRLLMWATVGFAIIEPGGEVATKKSTGSRRSAVRPGGDPAGISREEADRLFTLHVQYLITGMENDPTNRVGSS